MTGDIERVAMAWDAMNDHVYIEAGGCVVCRQADAEFRLAEAAGQVSATTIDALTAHYCERGQELALSLRAACRAALEARR